MLTKVKVASTLIVIAIAALIISVKGTPHRVQLPPDSDLYEDITLSVLFTPKKRKNPVLIQAHVEDVKIFDLPRYVSPWTEIVRVPKGSRVSLYALQDEAPFPGNLDCLILSSNGDKLNHGFRHDPGSVRCFAKNIGR